MKPSLQQALEVIQFAESKGFAWPHDQMLLEAIQEEITEIKEVLENKEENQRLKEEIGDLLFVCISLCSYFSLDPDEILSKATQKFSNRFKILLELLHQNKKDLKHLTTEEKIQLWNKAKKLANNGAAGEN